MNTMSEYSKHPGPSSQDDSPDKTAQCARQGSREKNESSRKTDGQKSDTVGESDTETSKTPNATGTRLSDEKQRNNDVSNLIKSNYSLFRNRKKIFILTDDISFLPSL